MEKKGTKRGRISLAVMIIVSVILIPILIVNLVLIVKGSVNSEMPPDVFGIAPLAVTSGSMEGDEDGSFSKGALIFVKILSDEAKNDIKVGDVVTFRSGDAYVTHRVIGLNMGADGKLSSVTTKGDANNISDGAIPLSNVVGMCVGSVAGLGGFSMFLQTPAGILVFVGVPVLAFIGYDILRIYLYNRRVRAEEEDVSGASAELARKDEEIARLRAIVERQNDNTEEENSDNSDI